MSLEDRVHELIKQYRSIMGLDPWVLHVVRVEHQEGDPEAHKASCTAQSEYRQAALTFDFNRMETGDDLEEIVLHELAHCLTHPLEHVADTLAGDNPILQEWVRHNTERTVTDIGEAFLRFARQYPVVAKRRKRSTPEST